jgi:hypothetical protein
MSQEYLPRYISRETSINHKLCSFINETLHKLYSSPNIIRMIKSKKLRLAGHVERTGDKRNVYGIFVVKPE